jgi:hypothetical protein
MRVVRIGQQARRATRTVRGFCRTEKIGRITRAQAVKLALLDLADQIRAARLYGTKQDVDLIRAHLLALKQESR